MVRALIMAWVASLASFSLADSPGKAPALLLVPGVYGLPTDAGAKGGHIHPDFLRAIDAVEGRSPDQVNKHLKSRFDEAFSQERIDRITPATKYRTYAVSLEVIRADQYQVMRPDDTVDLYLPVSVRLYVTSILSGEVLFSQALTSYRNLRVSRETIGTKEGGDIVHAAYRENLLSLVDKVIAETREKFRPFQISARVVRREAGLFVVDRGMDAGIARGVELVNAAGEGIRILHAGKGYAVGELTLGEIREGDELAMYATTAAADVVKPRALVMKADSPSDLPGNYAAVLFSENLGSRAAFTVVPVNPDFQAVLQSLATTEGLQQSEVTQKRVLPDYFVRLKVSEPVLYEAPTSKGFSTLRILSGSAWAELLDAQGRVVYVTRANEQIEDQIVDGGIAFDAADRRKVLFGNLLKTLGDQFIRDVRFKQDALKVAEVSDLHVSVTDPLHRLSTGQDFRLYRSLSLPSLGAEPVLVPIWDMTATDRKGEEMALEYQLPISVQKERLRKGDIGLLQMTAEASGQPASATLCPSLQDKGSVLVPDIRALAYFAFGSGSQLPYFGGDIVLSEEFPTLAHERERLRNAGFAKGMKETPVVPGICLQPLVKIDELSRSCDSASGLCDVELQFVAGVNLLSGNAPIGKKILVSKSQLKHVPHASSELFIRTQAALKLFPLLADSVRQLDIPADAFSSSTVKGNLP